MLLAHVYAAPAASSTATARAHLYTLSLLDGAALLLRHCSAALADCALALLDFVIACSEHARSDVAAHAAHVLDKLRVIHSQGGAAAAGVASGAATASAAAAAAEQWRATLSLHLVQQVTALPRVVQTRLSGDQLRCLRQIVGYMKLLGSSGAATDSAALAAAAASGTSAVEEDENALLRVLLQHFERMITSLMYAMRIDSRDASVMEQQAPMDAQPQLQLPQRPEQPQPSPQAEEAEHALPLSYYAVRFVFVDSEACRTALLRVGECVGRYSGFEVSVLLRQLIERLYVLRCYQQAAAARGAPAVDVSQSLRKELVLLLNQCVLGVRAALYDDRTLNVWEVPSPSCSLCNRVRVRRYPGWQILALDSARS